MLILDRGDSDGLWSSIDDSCRLTHTGRSTTDATHAATAAAGMHAAPAIDGRRSASIRAGISIVPLSPCAYSATHGAAAAAAATTTTKAKATTNGEQS
ncbi:hypothetical protein INT44_007964 [Umbelopsis vinacea]|uniref:Uncharacterized protein n=1 Tax=Umbelopsis vinacea TaxID=44442 RepID=A0A8H7PNW6_9FUNG|nr:hypothetical protein INT44_007964 [Umbelopsis vinacea]